MPIKLSLTDYDVDVLMRCLIARRVSIEHNMRMNTASTKEWRNQKRAQLEHADELYDTLALAARRRKPL